MKQRDLECLALINYHLQHQHYAISLRELGDAMGVSSSATIHARLARLKADGLVDFIAGDARTLHVTDDGREVLTRERAFVYDGVST